MKDKLRELAERWKRYDSLRMCANELLAILDAEGDGGAVIPDELFAWLTARDLVPDLDEDGSFDMHLLIEALNEHENELQATHPTRSGVVSDEDVRDAERYREQMSEHYIRNPNQLIDLARYANQFRPGWWMDKESWDAGIDFAIDAAVQGERHER